MKIGVQRGIGGKNQKSHPDEKTKGRRDSTHPEPHPTMGRAISIERVPGESQEKKTSRRGKIGFLRKR